MEAKSFEEGLTEVAEMVKQLQSTLMLYQSTLEELYTKTRQDFSLLGQDFSLLSEKFQGSIKAAIKEEIIQEGHVHLLGVQLNQQSPSWRATAKGASVATRHGENAMSL